jgi:hypothetical protein
MLGSYIGIHHSQAPKEKMYPRAISEALLRHHPEWLAGIDRYAANALQLEWAPRPAGDFAVEDWLLQHPWAEPGIGYYLAFLRSAKARFGQVEDIMGYWNPTASHSLEHDKWSVGWHGDAMLPLANYLYLLRSFGVSGDCLECGAFKGSSTACLSYACDELGLKLHCADSFAGLPSDEGHYGKGDFAGPRDEVEANVRKCGSIRAVNFIEGWYQSSLRGFATPLSLIWMDVDLQQSVLDAMENVFASLDRRGVIFSDGFAPRDYAGENKIAATGGEPGGFYQFFERHSLDVIAMPTGAKGISLILPHPEETPWLRIYPERFEYLLKHL